MQQALSISQVIISLALIITILLQQRNAGGASFLGGGSSDTSYYTKRGFDKILFISTIILAVLFLASSFLSLLI